MKAPADLELFQVRRAVSAAACDGDRYAKELAEQREKAVLPLRSICRVVQGFDGTPRVVLL